MEKNLKRALGDKFATVYNRAPEIVAYAPGRVELLGNHTDYNEGLVLSAAIDRGTGFALARRDDNRCRLTAGDLMATVEFGPSPLVPSVSETWANYVIGVLAGLREHGAGRQGFDALFFSNLPLGAGLSSSAALEMSAAMALQHFYRLELDHMTIARVGQTAEHRFAGVKCGLLDQITSLSGRVGSLVLTDFRSFAISTRPLGDQARLMMCNTHARHALVDGAYNQRRADCESAVAFFRQRLSHPVSALRDVSMEDWRQHHHDLDSRVARRAAHPIGETERVAEGAEKLLAGDVGGFGKLMFESHDSSRFNFENSCPELDFVVECAGSIAGVMGARLSGGGFGGSAVILLRAGGEDRTADKLARDYANRFNHGCDIRLLNCAGGATLVDRV